MYDWCTNHRLSVGSNAKRIFIIRGQIWRPVSTIDRYWLGTSPIMMVVHLSSVQGKEWQLSFHTLKIIFMNVMTCLFAVREFSTCK